MGRIFKFKKRKFLKLRYLLFIGLIYLSFDTTYTYLLSKKNNITNELYLKMMLNNTNNHFNIGYKPKRIINETVSLLTNVDIKNPLTLLTIKTNNENIPIDDNITHNDEYDYDKQAKITNYVKDPNPTNINNPIIYIYNSHQLENYNSGNLDIYNITPNVMMASYMLKEKLNGLGIPSIVNEFNLAEFIRLNNWGHADSYKASRIFMLDAKNKYDTLEYYIDIHRDSINKDQSTITINGKKYARTLFVIGEENPLYNDNLALANKLHQQIETKYPKLSRGVLNKKGVGVNGIYNQDISAKAILIEIGGYQNTFEEVMLTVDAISEILYEYIRGAS